MTPAERQIVDNIRKDFAEAGLTDGQQAAITLFMSIGKWLPDDVQLPPWLERYREFERRVNNR